MELTCLWGGIKSKPGNPIPGIIWVISLLRDETLEEMKQGTVLWNVGGCQQGWSFLWWQGKVLLRKWVLVKSSWTSLGEPVNDKYRNLNGDRLHMWQGHDRGRLRANRNVGSRSRGSGRGRGRDGTGELSWRETVQDLCFTLRPLSEGHTELAWFQGCEAAEGPASGVQWGALQ